MCIYGSEEHRTWFESAWTATGRKLDMGKGCVRIKTLDDLPMNVLGQAIKRVPVKAFITFYESMVPESRRKKTAGAVKKKTARAAKKKTTRG
jgi:hypothetical protein